VAIVHDYVTQRGGAERVVLALHRAFPAAPVHTSLFDPTCTFPEFDGLAIRRSPLDRLKAVRRNHRLALPLLAPAFSAMRVNADVVICSSSGWAHGVRTSGRKIVYCHAPARWLYQTDAYLARSGGAARAAMRGLRPALIRWDRQAASSADVYLANSNHTRRLIRDTYGIDAEVVFPPAGISPGGRQDPIGTLEPGFFLCISRLLAYKHVDAVIGAFADLLAERLVVVGTGPEESKLRTLASRNVSFLATVSDEQLRWLYANASGLVAASYEDFGLTPVEAAAFGTPSIALRYGGYFDTVREGVTGQLFDVPQPNEIARAVRNFDASAFEAQDLRSHASAFSDATFRARMHSVVDASLCAGASG
jgi:glycosyltransferase involved in cell wall biosynthesis